MSYMPYLSPGAVLQPGLICQHCDHVRAAHVQTSSSDVGRCVMDCDCLTSPETFSAFEEEVA